jgi:hypothetical protein
VIAIDLLRRRIAVARHRDTLRTNDALYEAARDLRRRAQADINAGRPDLAQPFIDEALMFEAATQPLPRS